MNVKELNKWIENRYTIKNVLTIQIIKKCFKLWWLDILPNLKNGNTMKCMFKLKITSGEFRSIGFLQIVNIKSKRKLLNIFIESWNIMDEWYHSVKIEEVFFVYKFIDDSYLSDAKEKEKLRYPKDREYREDKIDFIKIGGVNLPNTMDFTTWGECHFDIGEKTAIIKKSEISKYHVTIFEDYTKVNIMVGKMSILSFTDEMIDSQNLNCFIRRIDKKNQEYHYENGKIVFKKVLKKTEFLKAINESIYRGDKFITMDIETRLFNNIMEPYCVSIYDGKDMKTFYLSEYKTSDEMLISSIQYLMRRKYHYWKVYCHNFSKFDGIFLIRLLASLSDNIKLIKRDGRIINLRFTYGKYTIYFRDSLLLLPFSLNKLSKEFKVELKGQFPYKIFDKPDIDLNYEGPVPEKAYFDVISDDDYKDYKRKFINKKWNLRLETILYCEQDVRSLYQIIDLFRKKIYEIFRVDILKYPSLSSLAFAIYRSNFLNEIISDVKIPLTSGKMYDFIKRGYTGGSVDVYKPYGVNIYRYDVNSLYPYVMKMNPMPCGTAIYFEGDILRKESNAFGFFEVEVTAPSDIKIPLLQTRIKTKNGYRTLSPIGTWTSVYFSEELYNARKYGYNFKVKRGYLFEKKYIFSEYVNKIYDLKVNSEKGSVAYLISKLLLNSLYGRLGMKPEMEHHLIIPSNEEEKHTEDLEYITNIIDLKNGKEIISYYDNKSDTDQIHSLNISVGLAAAITAYARIHMSYFKTNPNLNIYYSDTDSIDIDRPLPEKCIGKEIGKMKLEHIFDEAIFLAPKVYGGKTKDLEKEKGKDFVKIKGLKIKMTFDSIKPLLYKDKTMEISQEKWHADISKGYVFTKNEIYTLMITDQKREIIYDENNKFIDTEPLKLNGEVLMKK